MQCILRTLIPFLTCHSPNSNVQLALASLLHFQESPQLYNVVRPNYSIISISSSVGAAFAAGAEGTEAVVAESVGAAEPQ